MLNKSWSLKSNHEPEPFCWIYKCNSVLCVCVCVCVYVCVCVRCADITYSARTWWGGQDALDRCTVNLGLGMLVFEYMKKQKVSLAMPHAESQTSPRTNNHTRTHEQLEIQSYLCIHDFSSAHTKVCSLCVFCVRVCILFGCALCVCVCAVRVFVRCVCVEFSHKKIVS
jgi:hypothetical protein